MTVSIEKVLSALRTFEHGATTKQLAAKLGMRPDSLGTRLSKQFLWGKGTVDREIQKVANELGTYEQFLWRTT